MTLQKQSAGRFQEWRTFFGEFRSNFETTGSILPSSRFLAQAITRHPRATTRPAEFLEVGPGTGPFTDALIRLLQPQDRLILVELNDRFVNVLNQRLESDPVWIAKRPQVEIIHGPAEDLPGRLTFNAIVCGLPFNNFPPELVERIFQLMIDRLRPGGTFSFFEYLWVRSAKSAFVGRGEKARLKQVGSTIAGFLDQYKIGHDRVVLNVPPAIVHHLQKPGT